MQRVPKASDLEPASTAEEALGLVADPTKQIIMIADPTVRLAGALAAASPVPSAPRRQAMMARGDDRSTSNASETSPRTTNCKSSAKRPPPIHRPSDNKTKPPAIDAIPTTARKPTAHRPTSDQTFAERLHALLSLPEYASILRWNASGDAFAIHDRDAFVATILARHFKRAKFDSFARRLRRWGFRRVESDKDRTGGLVYRCALFHREWPERASLMCDDRQRKNDKRWSNSKRGAPSKKGARSPVPSPGRGPTLPEPVHVPVSYRGGLEGHWQQHATGHWDHRAGQHYLPPSPMQGHCSMPYPEPMAHPPLAAAPPTIHQPRPLPGTAAPQLGMMAPHPGTMPLPVGTVPVVAHRPQPIMAPSGMTSPHVPSQPQRPFVPGAEAWPPGYHPAGAYHGREERHADAALQHHLQQTWHSLHWDHRSGGH